MAKKAGIISIICRISFLFIFSFILIYSLPSAHAAQLNIAINAVVTNTSSVINASQYCNSTISISTFSDSYQNKEKIVYSIDIDKETKKRDNFEIVYWIEDANSSANASDNMIRAAKTTKNPGNKSYTPSIKAKEIEMRIVAELHECDIFRAEKLIGVINPDWVEPKTAAKKESTVKSSAGKETSVKDGKESEAGDDTKLNPKLIESVKSMQEKNINLANTNDPAAKDNKINKTANITSADFYSDNARIKNMIFYFMIAAFSIVLVALVWRME